jgi:hypothetical protein
MPAALIAGTLITGRQRCFPKALDLCPILRQSGQGSGAEKPVKGPISN